MTLDLLRHYLDHWFKDNGHEDNEHIRLCLGFCGTVDLFSCPTH